VSIAHELEAGRWLKSVVEPATGLNAYLDIIPEDQDLPAIRFQVQRRSTTQPIPQTVIFSTFVFLVVVTIRGERLVTDAGLDVPSIVADMIAALHKADGETDKAIINACTYTESYGQSEGNGPDMFRHAGGMFEIIVQGKPVE
jgi:hypothetical protein